MRIQKELDSCKSQLERNVMGQFATPPQLAHALLEQTQKWFSPEEAIRFLDPAVGSGAFYSALLKTFSRGRIRTAVGFDIDPLYAEAARHLWGNAGLEIRIQDFTRSRPEDFPPFNLMVCNPPYVRHHHMETAEKMRLRRLSYQASHVQLSGLAGLYCHFLLQSHPWLEDGGIGVWLIPSEFMDVNYGQAIKKYLTSRVTLLHIHRFDPDEVQFDDALVSSSIVWFKKKLPQEGHEIRFSFGGTLSHPARDRFIALADLKRESKWTRIPSHGSSIMSDVPRLSDFFHIRRGLATGDNSFFILTQEEIKKRELPECFFRPILPSPRYLDRMEIFSDDKGNPQLPNPLFLLDCRLPEEQVQREYPSLWLYLKEGQQKGVADRYLCKHRSPWYLQEKRPSPALACTYLGRDGTKTGRPFRFILNHSQATVANVYLALYPREGVLAQNKEGAALVKRIWQTLNEIGGEYLLAEGRVYGGGLYKLEPKELGNVPITCLSDIMPEFRFV